MRMTRILTMLLALLMLGGSVLAAASPGDIPAYDGPAITMDSGGAVYTLAGVQVVALAPPQECEQPRFMQSTEAAPYALAVPAVLAFLDTPQPDPRE